MSALNYVTLLTIAGLCVNAQNVGLNEDDSDSKQGFSEEISKMARILNINDDDSLVEDPVFQKRLKRSNGCPWNHHECRHHCQHHHGKAGYCGGFLNQHCECRHHHHHNHHGGGGGGDYYGGGGGYGRNY